VRAAFVAAPEGARGVFPQFGYAIGRGCGKAVTRNTLRRRARAVARAEAETLPAGAFLLRFDPGAGSEAPARLRADVARALRRAAEAGEGAS